jgi:hypothetical protein
MAASRRVKFQVQTAKVKRIKIQSRILTNGSGSAAKPAFFIGAMAFVSSGLAKECSWRWRKSRLLWAKAGQGEVLVLNCNLPPFC